MACVHAYSKQMGYQYTGYFNGQQKVFSQITTGVQCGSDQWLVLLDEGSTEWFAGFACQKKKKKKTHHKGLYIMGLGVLT